MGFNACSIFLLEQEGGISFCLWFQSTAELKWRCLHFCISWLHKFCACFFWHLFFKEVLYSLAFYQTHDIVFIWFTIAVEFLWAQLCCEYCHWVNLLLRVTANLSFCNPSLIKSCSCNVWQLYFCSTSSVMF